MFSLKVWLQLVHLRNWVDDSSALLVCTCQAYALLFPHFVHMNCIVGMVLSWFSLSITDTSCLGLCVIALPLIFRFSFVSLVFCPHLLQVSIIIA